MHDANKSGTAVWTHRVLAAIARAAADGAREDVSRWGHLLAQVAGWEGCPTAANAVPGDKGHRYRRLSLRQPVAGDDYSVMLITWPPGHLTPIHDHDGLWGIELVLDGVLQVESFTMTVAPSLQLVAGDVTPLGIGDHATFSERDYAHRCRNLSAHRPALSLHVYGGVLERFCTYERDDRRRWVSSSQRAELELASR